MTTRPGPPPALLAEAIRTAIAAADAMAGATAPNPPVGCVLLDAAGATLAVAAHERAGGPHAEAAAIAIARAAGTVGRVHSVVVTLEPCNHHGCTGPCSDAVLATPARAVWIGAPDPNPQVAGGGAARLSRLGIATRPVAALDHPDAALLAARCARLIAPFATWATRRRPWLTIKQALDAKGGMIPPAGATTFTADASLDLAHRLRRRADAIVTGSGTILADDPHFTVRRVPDPRIAPRRLAILDRRGRVPAQYLAAARDRGFRVQTYGDISDMLADLAADDVLEALIECGPTLHAAFLDADLWDERVVIQAGTGAPDRIDVIAR